MKKDLKEKLKKELKEEEKKLKKSLSKFAKENPELEDDWITKYPNLDVNDLDSEEDEVEEFGNRLPVEFALELKLRDVKKALKKIDKGNYGNCEECGKEISEERLRVSPEAKKCINCLRKK